MHAVIVMTMELYTVYMPCTFHNMSCIAAAAISTIAQTDLSMTQRESAESSIGKQHALESQCCKHSMDLRLLVTNCLATMSHCHTKLSLHQNDRHSVDVSATAAI